MASFSVKVKWGKEKYTLELLTEEPPELFKMQLFSLTGVPPERQKLMLKGKKLADDATSWDGFKVKKGVTMMLMGTADKLAAKPVEKVLFVEDMSEAQLASVVTSDVPSGLQNLGNTCYLNSVVQTLRVVPPLRKQLAAFGGRTGHEADPARGVTSALRDLYRVMDQTSKPVPPLVFVELFKNSFPQFNQRGPQGQPAQQDAEECYSTLLHAVAQATGDDTRALFEVGLDTEMKCDEAPEEPAVCKTETTNRLQCHIQNDTRHLLHELRNGLEDKLEKASPSLGRDAVYTKTSRINSLPEYLTVHIVRFFWKKGQGVKAKILKAVKFPPSLDVLDFCNDSLKSKLQTYRNAEVEWRDELLEEERKKMSAATGEGEGASEQKPHEEEKKEEGGGGAEALAAAEAEAAKGMQHSGRYELCGVITHKGRDGEGGHYVGWVKDDRKAAAAAATASGSGSGKGKGKGKGKAVEDAWLKFDDDKVSEVKSEDIMKLDGGGDWHMAYMLLYRVVPVPVPVVARVAIGASGAASGSGSGSGSGDADAMEE